jgi:glucoamylase
VARRAGCASYFDYKEDCPTGSGGSGSGGTWPGTLSDVYSPPSQHRREHTAYIVTDGSTFTDLQARDMTYTVAADPTGMATVTSASSAHGYQQLPPTSPIQ